MDERDLCEMCRQPIDWTRPTLSISFEQWNGSDGTICEPCSLEHFSGLIERHRRERIGYDGPLDGLEEAEEAFDAEEEAAFQKRIEEYRLAEEKSMKHMRVVNRRELKPRIRAIIDKVESA